MLSVIMEKGDIEQVSFVLKEISGSLFRACKERNGSFIIKKMLERFSIGIQYKFFQNHLLLSAMDVIPPRSTSPIQQLSNHTFASSVIQKCLELSTPNNLKYKIIIEQIIEDFHLMITGKSLSNSFSILNVLYQIQ